MKGLRHSVFWPPFLLLIAAAAAGFFKRDAFISMATGANDWLLAQAGWIFSVGGLLMLITVAVVFFSPLGNVKIGGQKAKPMLKMYNWIAITLCTTIAAGVTFWGIVEPVYHLTTPPESMGLTPNSPEAATFAMSTMYLHWTITPYAIYCIPALMFAFAYYNMRKPFSLSSTLAPLFGDKISPGWGKTIDALCLYTLALGMAAAMGTAILNLAGGINYMTAIPSNPLLWAVITGILMLAFTISASTGLMKGISILSDLNLRLYIAIIAFILIAGPTAYMMNLGTESFGVFLSSFFEKSLFTGASSGDMWPQWWTVFYWANWFAWASITALFLGRISYGYTVKTFIIVNFLIPSVVGGFWMTIFGGYSIQQTLANASLGDMLINSGPETVLYAVLSDLPLSSIIIPLYIFIVFISFVTAADSNISAMAGISSHGITPESPEPKFSIKLVWGAGIGAIAWIMISFAQIDGIKMLSNLGGVPALILGFFIIFSLFKVAGNPKKYDVTSTEEYVKVKSKGA
ncbi:BCCT family transporter [Bacillus lacus]|uniref:BCCT family transporter n=1 Tax=Metabacillus lacus TaxID=1983721 RepID=A0A7X2J251_9BACI|nr:BCCT family transporter [Metabacillus lacus]MRX73929.1 BCCT family transporter [Metabacillus lacus]